MVKTVLMVFRKLKRKRKVKRFLIKNEKNIVLSLFGLFVIIGPVFGGTLVGAFLDKILIAGTVLANGRILNIF